MDSADIPEEGNGVNAQSQPPKGKAFEGVVADFYRALGYRVQTNIRLAGQEIDLLVSRYIEGVGPLTFMVECKDWVRPLGNQDVQNFISTVTSLRAAGLIQSGVMVSRSGFTPDGKSSANPIAYTSLLTPDDLEQEILDAAIGIRLLTQDYQDQDIYSSFVEIDGHKTSWQDGRSFGGVKDVCSVIRDSVLSGRHTDFFLLADYGAGKSTLLRRLQYELCLAKLEKASPYLPIFVPLKDYYEVQDFSILLRNSLRNDFLREMPIEFMWMSVRQGRFVFLLDGFDEMTERSGEERRYALFHKLLPVLSSPCPTILTSRPSMFLGRGEIEDLAARWKSDAAPLRVAPPPLSKPNKKAAQRYESMERLKATLMEGLLARSQRHDYVEMPTDESLTVINLKPFDEVKIRQYIIQRLAAGKPVPEGEIYSVEDMLSFINRVYDLSDLASRPLLLRLIIDTILGGGIDVTDTSLELGPSGLYEVYTSIKLEVDWEKGPVRRGALTREQRRTFAETVAVTMYERGTLEVDLDLVLAVLPSDVTSSDGAPLSAEEIATDFLTCSFLTIDERQTCRFVHKSFLEFFVARAVKSRLSTNNPLLQGRLSTEILYFLGGFAPTEHNVAQRLWVLFGSAPINRTVVRRNLLGAYLFTSPVHTPRRIRDAELSDISMSSLTWSRLNMRRCAIDGVSVRRLELNEPDWADVALRKCSIRTWVIARGSVSCGIEDSEFGNISVLQGVDLKASMNECRVASAELDEAKVSLELRDSSIGKLSATNCILALRMLRSQIEALSFRSSEIILQGGNAFREENQTRGVIGDSVVRFGADYEVSELLRFEKCIVVVAEHKPSPLLRLMSRDGCVLGALSVMEEKDARDSNVSCGVMGMTYRGSLTTLKNFTGWGIVVIEGDAASEELPKEEYFAIADKVLICSRTWFARETSAGGSLEIVGSIAEGGTTAQADVESSASAVTERLLEHVTNLSRESREIHKHFQGRGKPAPPPDTGQSSSKSRRRGASS